MKIWYENDLVHIGNNFISFLSPVVSAKPLDPLPDIEVITESGKYIIRDYDRDETIRVINVEGKTMQELFKENKVWPYWEEEGK